ncbi:MAG: hypothetical protein J6X55_08555 [Victivallales bacterium]|nr:hypothetical protein [Victivallales bacterium]
MSKMTFIMGMAKVLSLALVVWGMASCSTTTIPVSIKTPGEFNMSGVSKLAILDFNSVDSKPGTGVFEVDADTLEIVQGNVAAVFAKNKTYSIARLDAEKLVQENYHNGRVSPNNRFDGIVYGRVWWQVSPELCGSYPTVFTLRKWDNVDYVEEFLGQKQKKTTRVLTQEKDYIDELMFRSWDATLMLSLTIYKLDSNGTINKLTETFALANQKYCMDNGQLNESYQPIRLARVTRTSNVKNASEKKSWFGGLSGLLNSNKEAADVTGAFKPSQNTVGIPTEMQVKMILAEKLTADLATKLMPTVTTFNIEADFDDDKVFWLLKDGAFKAGVEYVDACIEKNVAQFDKDAEKIAMELNELQNVGEAGDKSYDMCLGEVKVSKETLKYINKNAEYFFARALCKEASGKFADALCDYRFIFHFVPTKESALGISRCLFALDMGKEVKKVNKEASKAGKKAKLN